MSIRGADCQNNLQDVVKGINEVNPSITSLFFPLFGI